MEIAVGQSVVKGEVVEVVVDQSGSGTSEGVVALN